MAKSSDQTIYVLNGPNLNMLGTREPETYGHTKLSDVELLCERTAAEFGLHATCKQSNHEGELVDLIHQAHARKAGGIVINPGACLTTNQPQHSPARIRPSSASLRCSLMRPA